MISRNSCFGVIEDLKSSLTEFIEYKFSYLIEE